MKELVGWECRCIFNLPSFDWPIAGSPAWVVVLGVCGNMIKLSSRWGNVEEDAFWCNTSIIKTISRTDEKYKKRPRVQHRNAGRK